MTSEETGTLLVRRPRLRYADRGRTYRVFVDDVDVGGVRNGETLEVPLSPGPHRVELRIDWTGSQAVNVELLPGSRTVLVARRIGNILSWDQYLSLSEEP